MNLNKSIYLWASASPSVKWGSPVLMNNHMGTLCKSQGWVMLCLGVHRSLHAPLPTSVSWGVSSLSCVWASVLDRTSGGTSSAPPSSSTSSVSSTESRPLCTGQTVWCFRIKNTPLKKQVSCCKTLKTLLALPPPPSFSLALSCHTEAKWIQPAAASMVWDPPGQHQSANLVLGPLGTSTYL